MDFNELLTQVFPKRSSDTKLKCLIVDDDVNIAECWRTMLLPEKLEINTASTSRGARQMIRQLPHDFLILDWTLDAGNGDSVLDEWMTVSAGPCIVISGFLTPDLVTDIYSRGASHVLHKPVAYATLKATVNWSTEWVRLRKCALRVESLERIVYGLIVLFAMAEGPRMINLISEVLV